MSSNLQKQDYYFGAGLFKLLSQNRDSRPSLLECSENVQEYQIITDTSEDFNVYMKYAGSIGHHGNERFWQFKITESDKKRFSRLIETGMKTYLMLICGDDRMKEGEVALFTANEFLELSEKSGVRIKLIGNRPKVFTVADLNAKNERTIPRNRIERRLTDIQDARW